MTRRLLIPILALATGLIAGPLIAASADQASLTVAQVRAVVAAAKRGSPPNFAGKRLIELDLDHLSFRSANFAGADLLETSFRGADLSGASFAGANLSAVKLADANAQRANFSGVTFLTTAERVDMRSANLSRSTGYLIAPQGKLAGATLAHARLNPEMSNQPMGLLHTIFSSADLTGADLTATNLSFADLSSAKFIRVKAAGANFYQADLSRADFTGADLTNANFAKADLTGAVFANVRGRATMRGLKSARNADQAVFR
jgi:uncharacterized protein YjbI with pentapeptide repeats